LVVAFRGKGTSLLYSSVCCRFMSVFFSFPHPFTWGPFAPSNTSILSSHSPPLMRDPPHQTNKLFGLRYVFADVGFLTFFFFLHPVFLYHCEHLVAVSAGFLSPCDPFRRNVFFSHISPCYHGSFLPMHPNFSFFSFFPRPRISIGFAL